MKTTKIEQPMRQYLDSLKVRGHKILSDDTMNYLTAPGSQCAAYEFKQEGENDHERRVKTTTNSCDSSRPGSTNFPRLAATQNTTC